MIKKIKTIFAFVFGFFVVLFLVGYGYQKYSDWEFDRETERLKQELERPYLEDTYGGKTPKETLEMFIAAVEKEDFDLASKYFVLSKQEEWRDKLIKGKENNNIEWFLDYLKRMEENEYLNPDVFQMKAKNNEGIYTIFMTFTRYPKGIWKIQEI